MSVKIRLARRGRKKMAIYDVVVADARAPRDGRFIEKIGSYNPNTNPASININNERALKWLLNGAQPTDTVKAMLSYRGVMLKKHLQIGVLKGAIDQATADAKFEAWVADKDSKIAGKLDSISKAKSDARQVAQTAETAKNQARIDAIKAKEDAQKAMLAAAEAANSPAPIEEVVEEVAPETEAIEAVAPEVAEEIAPEAIEAVAPEVVEEVAPEAVVEVTSKASEEVAEEVAPEVSEEAAPEDAEEGETEA